MKLLLHWIPKQNGSSSTHWINWQKTTLVIAHRLATIKDADRVIVVTNEGIAEQGSYQELLARDGVFARLHKIQYQQH